MKILNVKESECVKCKSCVKVCPNNLFVENAKENNIYVQFYDPNDACIKCGHCVAVCNYNAINYEDSQIITKIKQHGTIDFNLISKLFKEQRSIRRYSSKEVSKEDIYKILEIMRYAPTGRNVQACEYIIINDDNTIAKLKEFTIKNLKGFLKLISIRKILKPFIPEGVYNIINKSGMKSGIIDMIEKYKQGKDPVFFNAPYVILVTVPNMSNLSFFDPTIAITYGRTAAHSLGLGSCWIGAALDAIKNNKKAKKMLGIDKNRIIAGVITLGYPLVSYHSIPSRNPVSVKYL